MLSFPRVLMMHHITWMGTGMFSHLYLVSGLSSMFFRFYWQNRHNQGIKRESLGASGAIAGLMSYWALECHRKRVVLKIQNHNVSPLLWWGLYAAIDMTGLLQYGKLQNVLKSTLDILFVNDDDENEKNKRKDENNKQENKKLRDTIAYDAHIGGALAGILAHVVTATSNRL